MGIAETREFFGPRAREWEDRFPDDDPLFAAAVTALGPPVGGAVLDAACGTGRAGPALRRAVGPHGCVIAADVTPQMLAEVVRRGRTPAVAPLLTDVGALPLPGRSLDAVFAAGLIPHLADPAAGLSELARVCRTGGRLALFHPIGRASLARRHGHPPDDEDVRAAHRLGPVLASAGWVLEDIDDGEERYLALARRLA